jgi:hypothetical protein
MDRVYMLYNIDICGELTTAACVTTIKTSEVTLTKTIIVRSEVLTAVAMKNSVFRDVMACGTCKN